MGRFKRSVYLGALGLAISAGGLTGCDGEGSPPAGGYPAKGEIHYPGSSWQTAGAETVGLSKSGLDDAIRGMNSGSDCVAVVKDGYMVASEGSRTRTHNPWSVGKSVLSAIIGIMYTNGTIDSLDDPGAGRGNSIRENLEQTINGSWSYSPTGGQSRAADIVADYSGTSVGRAASRYLFDPLGMTRSDMASSGFMNTTCEDLARVGLLLASGGEWDGKKLISDEYMEEAVKPVRGNSAYGFLFWLNHRGNWSSTTGMSGRNSKPIPGAPDDLIVMKGLGGQIVLVMPSSNIVVVRLGTSIGDTMGVARDIYNDLALAF